MPLPCTVTADRCVRDNSKWELHRDGAPWGWRGVSSTHTSTSGKSFNLLGKISDSSTRT